MTTKDNSDQNKKTALGMRNVIAMGFVSFFTDFSTEMILGVLPLFIITNLGASRSIFGGIEGSAELISYASSLVSGSLSDKLGKRKIFVLAGYALSTISKPFFAATTGWFDAFIERADASPRADLARSTNGAGDAGRSTRSDTSLAGPQLRDRLWRRSREGHSHGRPHRV